MARGGSPLRCYLLCLVIATCCSTTFQCALQASVRAWFAPRAGLIRHPWSLLAYDAIDLLNAGGCALFVFHSRRSVVRILNRLRFAELARVRLERSVTESRLAAARTQMDSAAMLEALREIGALYRIAPEEADARFDGFVESLQSRRSALRRSSSA